MISIISPAKSLDFPAVPENGSNTTQGFITEKSERILAELQGLSSQKIKKLMGVSENIAELNFNRFANFAQLPEKAAFFAYNGDVYKNINRKNLTEEDINFLQKHLRIISGLYGILKPLDAIKPYRLEASIKLSGIAPVGLAVFWREEVTEYLNNELAASNEKTLINLASDEYSAVIDPKKLQARIINICFREYRDGVLRNIALNAKKARGMMVDFIMRNRIDNPRDLEKFDRNGYKFIPEESTDGRMFFVRTLGNN